METEMFDLFQINFTDVFFLRNMFKQETYSFGVFKRAFNYVDFYVNFEVVCYINQLQLLKYKIKLILQT